MSDDKAQGLTQEPSQETSSEVENRSKDTEIFIQSSENDEINENVSNITSATGVSWRDFMINLSYAPEEPSPIISHNNRLVGSRRNITAITGKPKSTKTFLGTAMVGGFLREDGFLGFSGSDGNNSKVLWIDTEQAPYHVSEVARRVHRIAGLPEDITNDRFIMLSVREIDPTDRCRILEAAMADIQPDLVCIDGISDLLTNTNDIKESEELISILLALSSKYNNHIVAILHTNPKSDKARGHLGSTLERKAETMLLLNRNGSTTTVTPQFSRNVDIEEFSFAINENGLPYSTSTLPKQPTSKTVSFEAIMKVGREYRCNELIALIVEKDTGTSKGAAMARITRACESGNILKNERGRYHLPDFEKEVEEIQEELHDPEY